MTTTTRTIGVGSIGGIAGGVAMEAIREPLVRRGEMRWTPPRRIVGKLVGEEDRPVLRTGLHLGYAAALGGIFELFEQRASAHAPQRSLRTTTRDGAVWGGVVWASNLLVALPIANVIAPPDHQPPRRLVRELGIHVLYGVVTALVARAISNRSRMGA